MGSLASGYQERWKLPPRANWIRKRLAIGSQDRQQASVAHLPETMKETSGLKCPVLTAEVESLSGLEDGRLYSAKAVSKCIGIHERTITGNAEKGDIGYYAMGTRKLFSKTDIEEYLRRTYRPAKSRGDRDCGEATDSRQRRKSLISGAGKEGK
jgi:excisionase family DNA binding protein